MTGTNPFRVTTITGNDFTSGGSVNKVQLDDVSGHTYSSVSLGTVANTTISGTTFNLASAIPGTYFVKVSKDGGSSWTTSGSRLLTISSIPVTITGINANTAISGTNSFKVTSITGTNFTVGGIVNAIQLDDDSGHFYNASSLGTIGATSITGTIFNLTRGCTGNLFYKGEQGWRHYLVRFCFKTLYHVHQLR